MEGLGGLCVLGTGLFLLLVWTLAVSSITPRPKHFYRIWIGVPVLVLVVLICMLVALSFCHALPGEVFRDSVGFDPTPGITIVRSLRHMPTDWDDSYLEFYASDSTINRILQNGFTSISRAEIVEYATTPGWWRPPTGPGIRIYATNNDDPKFRDMNFRYFVSHRLLVYDPDSGTPEKRLVYLRYRH
jgi:hypothetical protein